MVASDAAAVDRLVTRMVASDSSATLAARVDDGRKVADRLGARRGIDLVVLDIGMSEETGIEALGAILAAAAGIPVLMISTLSFRNVKLGMRGLLEGAADYIALPQYPQKRSSQREFRADFQRRVENLAGAGAGAPAAETAVAGARPGGAHRSAPALRSASRDRRHRSLHRWPASPTQGVRRPAR